jgi:hypothetical protein
MTQTNSAEPGRWEGGSRGAGSVSPAGERGVHELLGLVALRQAARWLFSAHRVSGRKSGPTSWCMVVSLLFGGWAPSGPSPVRT